MTVKKFIYTLRALVLLTTVFIFFSCSITPESALPPSISQEITKVDAPKITTIKSNNDILTPSITITWTPIDKATFYIVEYVSATDYLSGAEWKQNITSETSYTLQTNNSNDMRFVFRVKSGVQIGSKKIIESGYSNEIEGAVINTFSLNFVIKNNKLNVYVNYPKNNSVLNQGTKIVSPVMVYYEGDYEDLSTTLPDESLESLNDYTLSSAEEKTFTAVMLIDNTVVERKAFTVKNSVDFYPPALIEMSETPEVIEVDTTKSLTIKWKSEEINAGLDSYDTKLKFEVQRKVDNGDWLSIKDSEGAIAYIDYTTSDVEYSYTDTDIEANKDYSYRVVSHYFVTIEEVDYQFQQDQATIIETQPGYLRDTKPKSFIVTYDKESDEVIDSKSGNASYTIELNWNPIHEIPEGYEYHLTRFRYDSISSGDSEVEASEVLLFKELSRTETSFTDTFTIEAGDRINEQSFIYMLQIAKESEEAYNPNLDKTAAVFEDGRQGVITTTPSISPVDFFVNEFTSVTGGESALADSIKINWKINTNLPEGLNPTKVYVKIYRTDGESLPELITKPDADNTNECFDFNAIHGMGQGNNDSDIKYFVDPNVEAGKTYQYKIQAYYLDETDTSNPYTGDRTLLDISGEGNVLKPVTNVTATINNFADRVELSWTPVEYAKDYRIYYRVSGSTDDFVEDNSVLYSETLSSSTTRISDDIITCEIKAKSKSGHLDSGVKYDFYVAAVDGNKADNKNDKDLTSVVQGSILGAIIPTVENRADSIRLTWDAVENVKEYSVRVYTESSEIPLSNTSVRDTGLSSYEYVLEAEGDIITTALTQDSLALSRPYYFTVTPKSTESAEEASIKAEGHWYLPPTNITATKGEYGDLIYITWVNAEESEGVYIYKRLKNSSAEWEKIQFIPKGLNSFEDVNDIQDVYEYSLSTVIGEEGPIQDGFSDESNIGYPILAPEQFSCIDQSIDGSEEYFVFSFKKVLEETKYKIIVGTESIDIDLTDESKNSAEIKIGNFQIDDSGLVTYIAKRYDVTKSVYMEAQIYTIGAHAAIYDKNTSIPSSTKFSINYIKDFEVVNVLNTILNKEFIIADNSFNGDWWIYNLISGKGMPYTSELGNGYFHIETAFSKGLLWINDETCGKLIIGSNDVPYKSGEYSLSTDDNILIYANTSGGYEATNSITTLTGSFTLKFPGKFPTKKISMQSYRVDNASGQIYIDDSTTSVALEKITTHIL